MTNLSFALQRFLIDRYDDIKRRLTARLGSSDLAGEAMQDAWLRMAQAGTIGPVRDPEHYVIGVAMNAARDHARNAGSRFLNAAEVENLLEVVDEAPDPARVAEMRSELRRLETILDELPPRQRAILLAARLDQTPRVEIARHHGISVSLVEKELQRAQEYCLARRTQAGKNRQPVAASSGLSGDAPQESYRPALVEPVATGRTRR